MLHNQNLGYALAIGMILITALSNGGYIWLSARSERMRAMKQSRLGAWLALIIGTLYFVVPLIGTFEFSLRMRRGAYSFDAYRVVFSDPRFQASFGYSTVLAIATIIVGVLLVVPTAYWVQLRLPRLRPVVEFLTLLPLVIPAIVLVFGYIRIYNSSSSLPFTANERSDRSAPHLQLCDPGTALHVSGGRYGPPGHRRADPDGGRREHWAQAGPRFSSRVILPNVRVAVLSGAFLTFAIVIGEFTMASLLTVRPSGLICS